MATRLGSGITAVLFVLLLILPSTSLGTAVHTFDCKNCHIPSLSVTQLGGGNVCLRCHYDTIDGSGSILSDGTLAYVNSAFNPMDASHALGNNPTYYNASGLGQTSHNWGASDTQPRAGAVAPAPAQFYSRYGSSTGKVTCSRCHNPHGTRDNPQLLTLGAGSTEAMCVACHVPFNKGESTDKTGNNTTHPVGISYPSGNAAYKPAPGNTDGNINTDDGVKLYDGKIVCGTCHQVHFADSNADTQDTPGKFDELSGGDGKLLRGNGAGRGNPESTFCQTCHTYQAHGNTTGERAGCLVCHGGHSYDPVAPNYFMLRKTATTTKYNTVNGLNYSSADVLDLAQKFTCWNDQIDGLAEGYCEKCHGDARTIGTGAGKYHVTSAICTDCHAHSQADGAFAAICNACHGMPPVSTDAGGPDGLVAAPGPTNSATAGAHATHVGTKGYLCDNCHANSVGSGSTHNDGAPQSVTIGFSLFGEAFVGGTYDGQAGVAYDASQANTTVTSSGTKTCANTYCHGNYPGSGKNASPQWDDAGTAACGSCHGGSNSNVPVSGSHNMHAGGFKIACTACHNGIISGSSPGPYTVADQVKHVDGKVDWAFNSADSRLQGGSERYNIASGTSSPSAGTTPRTYSTCENIYCHSNAQPSGGVGKPDSYATPAWGSTGLTCDSCHKGGVHGATGPLIDSGNHTAHLAYSFDPSNLSKCSICHSYVPNSANIGCNNCHDIRNPGGSLADVFAKHVDGKVTLEFSTKFGSSITYSGTPQPGDGYGACSNTYCHSTVQSGSDGTGPPVYGTPTWGANTGCAGCHSGGNHQGPYSSVGADGSLELSGSHTAHRAYCFDTAGTSWLTICTTCHAWDARPSLNGCNRCHTAGNPQIYAKHVNGKIDIVFYPDFTGGSYNGSGVPRSGFSNCSNTYCHSNATSVATGTIPTNTSPRWGSGKMNCDGCHGFPPAYSNGSPKTNSHGRHNYGCNTCHNTTTSNGTTITATSAWGIPNHVDKMYTVSPGAGATFTYSYNASGGTCSNISCHSNKSAQWGGTVACGDCHAATAGTLTTGSHAAHLTKLNGPDGVVGSTLNCDGCHGSGAKLGTHTGHVNGVTSFADGTALAATNVCNTCHSPAGSYDGVNDAVVGAKDNWHTGIYTDGNLIAGKERWCVTCHDESPANSKTDGTGVSARNMVGNNSTWGFYQTGHGADISVDCVQCHSTRMPHIDHIYTPILDVMKTTQNPNNYRFYVGKGMRMPYDGTSAPESRELCISCHSETTLYKQSGLPADATTNFRSDSADGTGYQNLHFGFHRAGSNCITCHDPHGTSAPRMTADDRIGRFRLITLNAGDGKYYELSDRALWNSAANNHGGASTGPASCGTCHGYVTLSAGASEPTSTMYQRLLVPISFQTVTDLDTDGLPDTNDNCPAVSNAGQADTDGDGVGDACDNSPGGFDPSNRDRDYDGIGDVSDSCPDDPNNDIDADGVCVGAGYMAPKIGGNDNCPVNANPTQADNDGDGHPDACDNCPSNANADQSDYDLDGIGDACDASCDSFRNVWSQFLYPPAGAFTGLALDASDNVYGSGYVSSALPGLTYVGGYKDLAILKYDKDGNLQAKAELGSPNDGWEGFEDVAVDKANGFVYATGYTTGSLPGHMNLGSSDVVLAKYDANLNQIWAKQIATAGYDHGFALAIDASGNIYVGAKIYSLCTLVKYDPAGNELWSQPLGGTAGAEITSVTVDGAYVYAGGAQAGNVVVKQFGLDGTAGWSSQQGTAGTEAATSIVVTGSNVFVSGTTFGSFPGFTVEGTQDIFVLKLNKTDGSLMAATQFNAPDSQNAQSIDTDSTGTELYVTGSSWNGFLAPNPGGRYDAFLLSFDTDLNVLRRRQIADTLSNGNADIAVSKLDGSIYMAGARNNSGNFSLLKEQKGCP